MEYNPKIVIVSDLEVGRDLSKALGIGGWDYGQDHWVLQAYTQITDLCLVHRDGGEETRHVVEPNLSDLDA